MVQLGQSCAKGKFQFLYLSCYVFQNSIRNTATNTVEQRLVFTGDEDGKLVAFRNLIREVHFVSNQIMCIMFGKERKGLC